MYKDLDKILSPNYNFSSTPLAPKTYVYIIYIAISD